MELQCGRPANSGRLVGAENVLREELGRERHWDDQERRERLLTRLRGELGASRLKSALDSGAAMARDEAMRFALSCLEPPAPR